jgi:hypothetical protein
MSIHSRRSNTVGLVLSNNSIIGDNGTLETKEGSIPINNQIIALSSTDDISTTTEPSEV